MNKKRIALVCVIVAVLMAAVVTAQATGLGDLISGKSSKTVTISQSEYEEYQTLKARYGKLNELYEGIDEYYYIEPDTDLMLEYAARGLMAGLDDPYSFYYNPEEWAEMWEDDEGEYGGIGIQLLGDYTDYSVTVTRVFKNTPAEAAGIRKGDLLIRVEDIDVDASTMQQAVNVMRGLTETTVNIEVIRGEEHLVFDVPRAIISINRIEYTMLDNDVGYIVLYEFAGESEREFADALKILRDQGAKALVVDLRDNPGGWVSAATSIADLFVDKCTLVYAEYRGGVRENYTMKDGKDDIPLVMLVNGSSASSSEILAGGLQDLGRAKVVGIQSYGKGIMQYVLPLSGEDEDGYQLTCAQYFTSSGKTVHKVGITPDLVVEQPEEQQTAYFELGDLTDTQLKAAWELAVSMKEQ